MPFFSGDENTMRDDMFLEMIHPFGFLLYINHDKLKIFAYAMVLYLETLNVWSIYYLTNNFDLFMQYNSLLLAQQFGVACAVYLTISYPHITRFKDEMKATMWPLDVCGPRASADIRRKVRRLKFEFAMIVLCAVGGHLLFMPFVGDESDIFIEIKLVDGFLAENVWSALFYVVLLFLGMSNAGLAELFIYFSVHMEVQFRLLNLKVENISTGLEGVDEEDRFQETVASRLRVCVARHVALLKLFQSMKIIHNNWPVLIFSMAGVLILVSEAYMVLAGVSAKSNTRVTVALPTSVYIAYLFVVHGQQLKDEYVKLHRTAQNCSWHGWDKRNMYYLQMLLIHSSEPIKITSFDMVDLDYTLSVKMTKIVYSVLTALLNLRRDEK